MFFQEMPRNVHTLLLFHSNVKRNATAVNIAITTAEMACSGIKSAIPFDEVVESMAEVGRTLPKELRETGLGGIANSPTARNILKRFGN